MGEATIVGSKWKEVEVGRILYIPPNSDHPYAGKIATIVEIIDHKRVWHFQRSLGSSGRAAG